MADKQSAPEPEPLAWDGGGQQESKSKSPDVPAGEREATRQEEREATEEFWGPEHGRRGDLGDSGPGED